MMSTTAATKLWAITGAEHAFTHNYVSTDQE